MCRDTVLRSQQSDPAERDGHASRFSPSSPFHPQQNRQRQRVNRSHSYDHRGMTDRGIAQSDREARLIDGDAEEAQIKEGPEIAPSKTGAARSRGLRKHWQTPADSVDRHHDRSRENDAER